MDKLAASPPALPRREGAGEPTFLTSIFINDYLGNLNRYDYGKNNR